MEPEANGSFSDPFLAHLVLILSIYQFDLPRSPIPRYDGPSTWQTDNILRALNTISNRMYTAEDTLAFIKASENWENNLDAKKRHGLGDIPQPSNPSAELSQGSLSSAPPFPSFNVATSLKTSSSSGTPLVVPPSPPSNTAFETDKSAVDELRLVKAQVSDIVRVCDAVARGDLSHKITVPVQDAFMAKVKDVINGMVDKLVQFAKEVTRVSHEFGTQCIFGGHACMDGVQGIWADLTINLNVSFCLLPLSYPCLMLSPNCLIFFHEENGEQYNESDALDFRGH
jgi:HAMP domain-containing protein